ncbi:GYDIA family GHMP kinase [uncultured Algibacter sp.]|uniref:GYDIA family GHMP kinase n=1 Tax=uncultured Algibacter sp. TaxID=298659 RepID=UPI00261BFF84|nr:GYDIA family GHMP kinase [uncultured Algibacter sp.]
MKSKTFYSHGKLLLSGEYVVLDGASSLAIPTKYGQSLIVEIIEEPYLHWKSFDENKSVWFEDKFLIEQITTSLPPRNNISDRLIQILNVAKNLNPSFLNDKHGFKVETHLEFPKNWGLGTSSTLINNIAQWANIDAYKLLEKTFGGSGYDIACAQYNTPITYQIDNKNPIIKPIDFNPQFKDHLYFVHLNKKQNSRDGIRHYHDNKENSQPTIEDINKITSEMISCKALEQFQNLMLQHETIISKITKQVPIKDQLFKDFDGAIKSLGAWGGDFVLVATKHNLYKYFKDRGYTTIIQYSDMILQNT